MGQRAMPVPSRARTTKPEPEDRLKTARKILVTLQQPELFRRNRKVLVTPGGDGELPARLVDPVDRRGRVIPGEWTEPVENPDAEGVAYRLASASTTAGPDLEVRPK
jgi:hypothetical protein